MLCPPVSGSPDAGVFCLLLCPRSLDHLRLEFSASLASEGGTCQQCCAAELDYSRRSCCGVFPCYSGNKPVLADELVSRCCLRMKWQNGTSLFSKLVPNISAVFPRFTLWLASSRPLRSLVPVVLALSAIKLSALGSETSRTLSRLFPIVPFFFSGCASS